MIAISYWNNKKNPELVKILDEEMPVEGKVLDRKRKALEDWRRLSNAYYRWYNDGDSYRAKLRAMAKRYNVALADRWDMRSKQNETLEELADAVFQAAIIEKLNVKGN